MTALRNADSNVHCKFFEKERLQPITDFPQVVQSLLLGLALAITVVRCWIRLHMEHRQLTVADYLVCGGWICALGWVACSTKALYILIEHPLDEETMSDSIVYLKVRRQLRLGLGEVSN